ncbi:MAG TPA: HlyD family type I secretion periplasmic adaptor subunit [Xanthobacteraceae bacterium]|nr:HlyD family type I secretion periplasmic adaptor subunit [Xanthobacteraceae bacterium]
MNPSPVDPRQAIRKLNLIGFAAVALLVGVIGSWAASTHIAGAVIGPGTVMVESNVKKVQHPTGGVVGQIFVQEGSVVEEGQIVIRLDDTVTRSTLGVVRSQLDELTAREARLLAEREEAESITFPKEFVAYAGTERGVAIAIAGEEKLFDSRKRGRTGQRAQLRERITQTDEEITGLVAQQKAKENEIKFISEELVGVSQLYKQNLVSIQRFMALQRDQARLEGERGQFIAAIARARAKNSETELQILQLDQDFRTEVLKDLREAQGKIAELKERVTAAEDQLKRVDIRAPQSGIVHQLSVHTVGGVIGNGETIMQIVPQADKLMVEAKIAPQDIDQVALGAKATVRIMAGNQRTMPDIASHVTLIGADLTKEKEQPNQAYYVVRVDVPADQVSRLDHLKLVPGMPAEVFIQTRERTPLEYLLKPLQEQVARTFRER